MKRTLIIFVCFILLSAFGFAGNKKAIINLKKQQIVCWEQRESKSYYYIGCYQISSGMPGHESPRGKFKIHAKELESYSATYKCPLPYCCWFSGYTYGIHVGVLPGYPASHGCIRLSRKNAQKFYDWADIGTQVIIR